MPTNDPAPGDLDDVVRAVRAALDGGPAYAPQPRVSDAAPPPGTALVLRTSGSTGTPREVALSATALRASAEATHERLGGPGRWLLVLPPTHVAGIQVITRSLATGRGMYTETLDRFTPAGFAALAADFTDFLSHGPRAYVSLVPTQLHRLVAAAHDGEPRGLDALTRFDAVLVGGAAAPGALLAQARSAGGRVVTTYGMSETSGGCVYDGVPLPGVRVRLTPPDAAGGTPSGTGPGTGALPAASGAGVIELSGPMLAEGYVGDPAATAAAFRTDPDGTRWFRTSDLGRLDDSRLTVLGRADDVVVTGGVNVAPAAVEEAVTEHLAALGTPGEVCVVGVPDPEWGEAVVAVVARTVPARPAAVGLVRDDAVLAGLRAAVGQRLGAAAAPRRVYVTAALPTRGPGKTDRRAVRDAVVRAEREPVRP